MDALKEVFVDGFLWPQPVWLLFTGNPKAKVSRPKPNTTEEMKENITMEVFFISQEEFRCVNVNFMEVSGMHAG